MGVSGAHSAVIVQRPGRLLERLAGSVVLEVFDQAASFRQFMPGARQRVVSRDSHRDDPGRSGSQGLARGLEVSGFELRACDFQPLFGQAYIEGACLEAVFGSYGA